MIAVIEAYCDESGIQEDARACAVAGWVATPRNWQRFQDRWLKASGGVDFHGKQFFARTPTGARVGPYKDWSNADAVTYATLLVEAILLSQLRPVGGLIDVNAFKALPLDDRKWLTGATWSIKRQKWLTSGSPNRPYYLGFIECLEGAASNINKPGWQVNFCFDQQNELAPWALQFFQTAKRRTGIPLSGKLGDAIFKSKTGVGGLQAADLLAHIVYRVWTSPFTKTNLEMPELKVMTSRLDRKIAGRITSYNARGLRSRLSIRQRLVRQT